MRDMTGFEGFAPETLAFLQNLAANNERAWFQAHKADYEAFVRHPMRCLVAALGPAMAAIDPALDTDPRGGAVSRIHRDVRFSHDKSPYRVNQWIGFKRPGEGWQSRPAFFMEFGPDGWRYGMGYYAAMPATMAAVRAAIDVRTAAFLEAMRNAAGFVTEGAVYRRAVAAQDRPPEVQDWCRRKTAYMVRQRPVDAAFFGPGLVEELREGFAALAPLYWLLVESQA